MLLNKPRHLFFGLVGLYSELVLSSFPPFLTLYEFHRETIFHAIHNSDDSISQRSCSTGRYSIHPTVSSLVNFDPGIYLYVVAGKVSRTGRAECGHSIMGVDSLARGRPGGFEFFGTAQYLPHYKSPSYSHRLP